MNAAVIIIGNEILSGKFADENGPFLITELRERGVRLVRLVTIDAIADEVLRCSELADIVITTGGVGPTHDDLTFEGVAQAFGVGVELNAELVAIMERFGLPLHDANLRMATVPSGTELVHDPSVGFPVVQVRNVYVLPGIPKLVRLKFAAIAPRLKGTVLHTDRVYVDDWESGIATALGDIVNAFPTVEIGSYPRSGEGPFRTLLTLESEDAQAVEQAVASMRASLPWVEFTP
jgi:molybdenum cofactor synthesis domain-containing protein